MKIKYNIPDIEQFAVSGPIIQLTQPRKDHVYAVKIDGKYACQNNIAEITGLDVASVRQAYNKGKKKKDPGFFPLYILSVFVKKVRGIPVPRTAIYWKGDIAITTEELLKYIPNISRDAAQKRLRDWSLGHTQYYELFRQPNKVAIKSHKIRRRASIFKKEERKLLEKIPAPSELEQRIFG